MSSKRSVTVGHAPGDIDLNIGNIYNISKIRNLAWPRRNKTTEDFVGLFSIFHTILLFNVTQPFILSLVKVVLEIVITTASG